MTRRELIEQLAARLQVPDHSAQVFLHAFFDVSKSMLRSGETVMLGSLGTWVPEHDEDGTMLSVQYTPSSQHAHAATGEEIVSGPASSIDARHFIPAAALALARSADRPAVDVEDIVAEVQREFGEEREGTERSGEEREGAGRNDCDAVDEEYPSEDEYSVEDEYPVEEEYPVEDEFLVEDDEQVEDDEAVEDDAVFHRNRDQLYHPPDERSNRTLLFVALGLTVVVLIIILSLLFGSDEKATFGARLTAPDNTAAPSVKTAGAIPDESAAINNEAQNTVRLTIQRSI